MELLFDLTFVVAFSFAGNEVAHAFAQGHWSAGLAGFGFSLFAIIWAWINFTWFASAFDTDDWVFRVVTFVQMVGVIIAALGIPAVFASLEAYEQLDNRVLVAGYVVMRVAMIFQWLRAARHPQWRSAAQTYALAIGIAQVGWIALVFVPLGPLAALLGTVGLIAVELTGPVLAERRSPTPWHPHHVAERYSLLAIIALGEGIVGAAVSLSAAVESVGWSWEAALVVLAGVGLTFGLWWVYFTLPSGEVLDLNRHKSFVWGYGHYLVFGSIAGVGAGLHVAAYYLGHEAHISSTAAVLTVVVPVGIYLLSIFALYAYLVGRIDPFHLGLLGVMAVFLALPVVLATLHVPLPACLVVLMLAPVVVIVGYERIGVARHATLMADLRARSTPA